MANVSATGSPNAPSRRRDFNPMRGRAAATSRPRTSCGVRTSIGTIVIPASQLPKNSTAYSGMFGAQATTRSPGSSPRSRNHVASRSAERPAVR